MILPGRSVTEIVLLTLFFVMMRLSSTLSLPQSELMVLYDLYYGANGEHWTWEKPYSYFGNPWNFSSNADPCVEFWQGVNCTTVSGEYHVSRLFLPDHNIVGTIPISIGNLSLLSNLDLHHNSLNGTIPESLGNLHELQHLALNINHLSGHISESIVQLVKLVDIELQDNDLTGTIPQQIGNLTKVSNLQLSNNHLTGPIPRSIGNLTQLQYLYLSNNRLTSTIPAMIGHCTQLLRLHLDLNRLVGHIPAAVRNLTSLQILFVFSNQLSGNVPQFLTNLTELVVFEASTNHLTGTIPPSLGQLTNLRALNINYNTLTGPIPSTLSNLSQLRNLFLNYNQLTGPVPESIFRIESLAQLYLDRNYLTGTIPESLGAAANLTFLNLSSNLMVGTLPDTISSLTKMVKFFVSNNTLSGTIPSTIGAMQRLQALDLSRNILTGSIPKSTHNLTELFTLALQDNHLEGGLANVFSAAQTDLFSIQLDNNQLTGELPASVFELPSLVSFSMVGSCLHGTLPENICNATRLEALILYGLTTGASCRAVGAQALSLYPRETFGGKFPSCLLTLPSLRTLLMSSNALTGDMHNSWTVGDKLIELDLSHNLLGGYVSDSVQNHTWLLLDLSHNRLSGMLQRELFAGRVSVGLTNLTEWSADPVLSLQSNRLSGPVPNSVQTLRNVTVLAGNLFQCRYDKSDLPVHDEDFDNYECASNSFDVTIYVWIVLVVCSIVMVLFCYRTALVKVLQTHKIHVMNDIIAQLPDVVLFLKVQNELARVGWYSAVLCLAVLMPYYAISSQFAGTHTHQYAYIVSAIYSSGAIPFALTLVLLASLLGVTYYVFLRHRTQVSLHREEISDLWFARGCVWALFTLVNVTVVLGINIAFVYIVLYENSTAQTLAQIALSLFKLSWSMVASPYIMRKLTSRFLPPGQTDQTSFLVQVRVSLFNNIAIPCLVVAAIDPNCFSNILLPPKAQTVEFVQPFCVFSVFACDVTSYRRASLQFTPPFTYSYQCSASFITSYAPAFIYMSISTVFLTPFLQYTLLKLYQHTTPHGASYRMVSWLLPRILHTPATSMSSRSLVGAVGTLATLFTQLGIMLTFGAIFPPVALAMAVSITAVVYTMHYKIQRYADAVVAAQLPELLKCINDECAGVGMDSQLMSTVKVLVFYCCAFYTLFLFDILGDAQGFAASVWVLIVVPLFPVVVVAVETVIQYYFRTISERSATVVEGVELKNVPTVNAIHQSNNA